MIAPLPAYKPRNPRGWLQGVLAIALIVSPVAAKSYLDQRAVATVAAEFSNARSEVLSRIDAAVENKDLRALTAIRDRYAAGVSDREFEVLLEKGLSRLLAREARMELAVSKHLDLARHQEEASILPDPTRPQVMEETRPVEPLSVLPQ